MANYAKTTNFASKDSLASGNPLKVIKGTEIDDEFEAIETMSTSKADLASPVLTGTPRAPTAASTANSTQIATTAFVQTAVTGLGVSMSNFSISEDASGALVFSTGGTDVMKIDSSGNITTKADITAFGTV